MACAFPLATGCAYAQVVPGLLGRRPRTEVRQRRRLQRMQSTISCLPPQARELYLKFPYREKKNKPPNRICRCFQRATLGRFGLCDVMDLTAGAQLHRRTAQARVKRGLRPSHRPLPRRPHDKNPYDRRCSGPLAARIDSDASSPTRDMTPTTSLTACKCEQSRLSSAKIKPKDQTRLRLRALHRAQLSSASSTRSSSFEVSQRDTRRPVVRPHDGGMIIVIAYSLSGSSANA